MTPLPASNHKLSAIIVEDEELSRETLRNYLSKYCANVTVVAEAANIIEGKAAIERLKPDVVFLDVEMPYGNAFDLLEQLDDITFETIFVTAFSNYAIQALNLSASYYLLKPLDIDELVRAVEKISQSSLRHKELNHTKILIDNIKIENKQLQKVVLPIIDGFEVVQVNQIIRCEALDNFTTLYLTNGRKLVICRTLKHFESTLADYDFIRVHKSHLINFQYIKQYKKGKGGQAIMSDGASVDISPNRKQEFLAKFS
jgi:two-component system, LytTR family, response regulator